MPTLVSMLKMALEQFEESKYKYEASKRWRIEARDIWAEADARQGECCLDQKTTWSRMSAIDLVDIVGSGTGFGDDGLSFQLWTMN